MWEDSFEEGLLLPADGNDTQVNVNTFHYKKFAYSVITKLLAKQNSIV